MASEVVDGGLFSKSAAVLEEVRKKREERMRMKEKQTANLQIEHDSHTKEELEREKEKEKEREKEKARQEQEQELQRQKEREREEREREKEKEREREEKEKQRAKKEKEERELAAAKEKEERDRKEQEKKDKQKKEVRVENSEPAKRKEKKEHEENQRTQERVAPAAPAAETGPGPAGERSGEYRDAQGRVFFMQNGSLWMVGLDGQTYAVAVDDDDEDEEDEEMERQREMERQKQMEREVQLEIQQELEMERGKEKQKKAELERDKERMKKKNDDFKIKLNLGVDDDGDSVPYKFEKDEPHSPRGPVEVDMFGGTHHKIDSPVLSRKSEENKKKRGPRGPSGKTRLSPFELYKEEEEEEEEDDLQTKLNTMANLKMMEKEKAAVVVQKKGSSNNLRITDDDDDEDLTGSNGKKTAKFNLSPRGTKPKVGIAQPSESEPEEHRGHKSPRGKEKKVEDADFNKMLKKVAVFDKPSILSPGRNAERNNQAQRTRSNTDFKEKPAKPKDRSVSPNPSATAAQQQQKGKLLGLLGKMSKSTVGLQKEEEDLPEVTLSKEKKFKRTKSYTVSSSVNHTGHSSAPAFLTPPTADVSPLSPNTTNSPKGKLNRTQSVASNAGRAPQSSMERKMSFQPGLASAPPEFTQKAHERSLQPDPKPQEKKGFLNRVMSFQQPKKNIS